MKQLTVMNNKTSIASSWLWQNSKSIHNQGELSSEKKGSVVILRLLLYAADCIMYDKKSFQDNSSKYTQQNQQTLKRCVESTFCKMHEN